MFRKKTRSDLAREAFEKRDVKLHIISHDPKKISQEVWHKSEQGRYIGSAVFGASDGIVTTFAVVAGVAGAQLNTKIVLILGLANLLADGFSMAAGDYLSEKSHRDYVRSEREREEWEVSVNPEGEREEIRGIYKSKGLEGESLEKMVSLVTSNEKLWVDTMMSEELGLREDTDTSPVKSALVTFSAFAIAGFMPLLAYIFATLVPFFDRNSFLSASLITGLTLFAVGGLRQMVTGVKWFKGGLEMLLIGGLSASVAFLVGYILRTLFNVVV